MKTSIIFGTQHRSGALYRCLQGFAENNINLTKITSRPMRSSKWEYVFYLDFTGGIHEENTKKAMGILAENAEMVRVLGSYPAGNDSI